MKHHRQTSALYHKRATAAWGARILGACTSPSHWFKAPSKLLRRTTHRGFVQTLGFLLVASVTIALDAHAQCAPIPGYVPRREHSGRCSCASGGVIVRDAGALRCSGAMQSGPNGGKFQPYGIVVAPGNECPYKNVSYNPTTFGGSKNCEKYCDECLSKNYSQDWWSDLWGGLNILFIIADSAGLVDMDKIRNPIKGKGTGIGHPPVKPDDDDIRHDLFPRELACLIDVFEYLLPAFQKMGDGGSFRDVIGTLNPLDASNFANVICSVPACLEKILVQKLPKLGKDITPAKLNAAKALFEFACSYGSHAAHLIECEAVRTQCETDLYGNQPIPNCSGIIGDPIWGGSPIQAPFNACLDCCLAQITHVFPWCQHERNTDKCQAELNKCLRTCRPKTPPTPTPTPILFPPPEHCPVMLMAKFCPRCPSGRCAEPRTSNICWVNAELTASQKEGCKTYFDKKGVPECDTATVCSPIADSPAKL